MQTPYEKLTAQLSKLFELEKADLDFGIHRIIKARQKHIRVFLGLEEPPANDPGAPTLKKIVAREMGELNTVELERQLEATADKIRTNYGQLAFENEKLTEGPASASGDGQLWLKLKEELDSGEEASNLQLEAEIYSHLTEFFSRYYDEADFLSKRRIKAGDAPYAVPYSGEEVMLHWANKDQYYIKSSKDLKDYTFTLPERFGSKRVQFKCERQDPVLNNNNAKREFYLDHDEDAAPKIETCEDADGKQALVFGFHFKIVDKTRTQPETKAWIEHLLEHLPSAEWRAALSHVPDGAKTNLLARHLNNYTRKNETDFFIHKQLGHFLRGELDFYIKNEVMHLDDIDEKSTDYLTTRVRLIKALRTIAHHIIRFLAQLENFQKKLWLKKKYVTETQYCFTLDRIFEQREEGGALIDMLLKHIDEPIRRYDGEMRSQHEEWVKLYAIDGLEDYPEDKNLTAEFLRAHEKLMLDTVFFPPSFKWKLLGAMDDLESQLDGVLLHSENFQALRLLEHSYLEKFKCVYLDPPYNTDAGPINYKNGYRSSSWSSMMSSRLSFTKPLLRRDGIISVTIDDYQGKDLQFILETEFGQERSLGIAVIRINPSGRSTQHGFSVCHEYAMFYGKTSDAKFERMPRTEQQLARFTLEDGKYVDWRNFRKDGGEVTHRSQRPKQFYPIFADTVSRRLRIPEMSWDSASRAWLTREEPAEREITIFPIDENEKERVWSLNSTSARDHLDDLKLVQNQNGQWQILRRHIPADGVLPRSWWANKTYAAREHGSAWLKKMFGEPAFSFAKAPDAVRDTMWVSGFAQPEGFVLDYFAGSGTTAHATLNLNRIDNGNRRYVLVEQESYFDTVLKPRIQKIVHSAEWKEGKPTAPETGISHGFKYMRLESYEDALNNLDLGEDRAPDLLGLSDEVREEFLFSYLLDVETRGHLLNLSRFRDPWGCQLKVHDPHIGRSEPRVIDLVETFNYLLGVTVREVRVQGTKDKPNAFLTIEGESPDGDAILIIWRRLEANPDVEERNRVDWPVSDNEDLGAFAATNRGTARGLNPADTEFHAIYVNGDHTLADPNSKFHCIEEVFYERMFADTGTPED